MNMKQAATLFNVPQDAPWAGLWYVKYKNVTISNRYAVTSYRAPNEGDLVGMFDGNNIYLQASEGTDKRKDLIFMRKTDLPPVDYGLELG